VGRLNPIRQLAALVSGHPTLILVLTGLLTLVAAAGIVDPRSGGLRLSLDVSTAHLLPDEDGRGSFYQEVRRRFGNDDTMLVVLATEDLFTTERLQGLLALQRRLESLPGVHEVMSLASATSVRGDEREIAISSPLDPVPEGPVALEALRREVLAHPVWNGSLVSTDGGAAALVVSFGELSEEEVLARRLPERVVEIAEQERGDAEVWVTGSAYVKLALTDGVLRDIERFVPAVSGIILIVLIAAFRSLRGVIVPALTIGIGVVWTLGTMGWLQIPLTLVTAILPPLLLTVGFTYAIHVVAAQGAARAESCPSERRSRAAAAIEEIGMAVVITGLTTAVGFASLMLSPIEAIREFGALAALGVTYTLIVSLTFAPACLALLPESKRAPRARGAGQSYWLHSFARRLASFDVRHRHTVLALGGLAFAVAIFGMTQVRPGMDPMRSFRAESRVFRDHEAINVRFDGVSPLSVVLTSEQRGAFSRPDRLREVEQLQAWLESQEEIGHVMSVVDLLRVLNAAMLGTEVELAGLPRSRAAVRQLLLLAGSEQRALIDAHQRSVRLLVRARGSDSGSIIPLAERIEERLGTLSAGIRGEVTGNVVVLNRGGDALARGQFRSLLAAVGVIFAVMVMMFASLRLGLAAFLPNVLPIAGFFGILGLTGIPLNPTTGLIACMALGIAVDATIHYFTRFSADARRQASEGQATVSALCGVIRPVSYTTLGLCLGFGALTIGEFRDHAEFGLLAAFTLGLSWLVVVTVTPALCAGLRVVTLWDIATLRLGAEPQRSVPLFRDLSPRQAGALLKICELSFLPADERLFAADKRRDSAYIVLEGELVAFAGRDPVSIVIGKLGRGDAVGAWLGQGWDHSANVDAVTDVRLLQLHRNELELLCARQPKIAATLDLNLERLLAEGSDRRFRGDEAGDPQP
jgi:predicted RND superfamily exporter protein